MKKGFTLVELLAVIALIAIISLLVTPVVLDYIGQSREVTNKESAELYIKQVEKKIMERRLQKNVVNDSPVGGYPILSSGNICLNGTASNCTDILDLDIEKSYPTSGTITISNEEITAYSFTINGQAFTKGS